MNLCTLRRSAQLRSRALKLVTPFLLLAATSPFAAPLLAQDSTYGFPAAEAARADGLVPTVDIQDDENGDRYSVSLTARSENGRMTHSVGVRSLPTQYWPDGQPADFWERKSRFVTDQTTGTGTGTSIIGSTLRKAMDEAQTDEWLTVEMAFKPLDRERFYSELRRTAIKNGLTSKREVDALRQTLIYERQAEIAATMRAPIDSIKRAGAKVVYECRNMPCLVIQATPKIIAELVLTPGLSRMDNPPVPIVPGPNDYQAATENYPLGQLAILEGTQLKRFVDLGYDGNNGSDADLHYAVIEPGVFEDDHPGFTDNQDGGSRIAGRYSCDQNGCASVMDFAQPPWEGADDEWDRLEHATAVAGIIGGDLRDDQDEFLDCPITQVNRSGFAGEAHGYFLEVKNGDGFLNAVDKILELSPAPTVVNVSMGFLNIPQDCSGESVYSQAVNQFFEHGILSVHAGSNEGHADPDDCTVAPPGDAAAAFTVGGTGNYGIFDQILGDASTVRNAEPYDSTPRGGTSEEGKGFGVVDLASYAHSARLFGSDGYHQNEFSGTSFAAPTVSAAALIAKDYFLQEWDNTDGFFDDPGVLFANMLLWGDRASESGVKLTEGFDPLLGAGRLNARLWESDGMGDTWLFQTGSTCVDEDSTHDIEIDDLIAVPNDVDSLKAVVFWYDPNHQEGGALDDIDVELIDIQDPNNPGDDVVLASSLSIDHKERVYSTDVAGKTLILRLTGLFISGEDAECGDLSRKIYYALRYQDEDSLPEDIWPG